MKKIVLKNTLRDIFTIEVGKKWFSYPKSHKNGIVYLKHNVLLIEL